MRSPDLSIIACCYNSAERVETFSRALRSLDCGGLEVEFVFVDNASTDRTGEMLVAMEGCLPGPVTVLHEPRAGLMHARLRALTVAKGEWLVFFDDDNEARFDYLQQLTRLKRQYPNAVAFTGNAALPEDYRVPPDWIPILGWIAVRSEKGEVEFNLDDLHHPLFPWGAGLAIRRGEMVEACREWARAGSTIVGRQGSIPSGGEDIWIMHFVTRSLLPVVFSESLHLTHRIDRRRFAPEYAARLGFHSGIDYLSTLSAVREFKPSVRGKTYCGLLGVLRAHCEASVHVLAFLFRPNVARMARAMARLGMTQSLMTAVVSKTWRHRDK